MIPQDAVAGYARSDEISDKKSAQFGLDIGKGIKGRAVSIKPHGRCYSAKDMVQIILSGICKMVDVDRVKLDFVNADVLIDEQSPETRVCPSAYHISIRPSPGNLQAVLWREEPYRQTFLA